MPLPLKPGYNFNFDRTIRPAYFEMSTAEAYTDFYGISYMVSGERLIYSPDFTAIVKAGELVFIPKNVYRRTTYISNTPYERILLKFTDSMISELLEVIGEESFNQLCREHVLCFDERTQAKIVSILSEMEQEWNAYNKYSELLLKGLLNKLIITCLSERLVNGVHILSLEKRQNYLADAIKYIKTHLSGELSLTETARHVNISPSYLSKIFTNHLHTSFSSFVLNERISYARKLLVESRLSMSEIAAESGFSSNSYFSDCFKRTAGISPLQFRKQNSPMTHKL